MKKVALIIAIVCCSAKSFCQSYPTPVTDTLGYLRYLVANKNNYIGHPFSKLEDSLRIAIRGFTPLSMIKKNNAEENAVFRFVTHSRPEDIALTHPWLVIVWQTIPDIRNSDRLFYQFNKGQYNPTVSQYYRPFIIKDIYLIE